MLLPRAGHATCRELTEHGLSGAEFDILAALRRAGKPYRMKPQELGRAVLLSSGGTTNTLNRLTARELADRSPDPDDGRSMFIRLTPEGVRLAERALLGNAAAHAEVFDGVPGADLDAAAHALRAVPLPGDRDRRRRGPAVPRERRCRGAGGAEGPAVYLSPVSSSDESAGHRRGSLRYAECDGVPRGSSGSVPT